MQLSKALELRYTKKAASSKHWRRIEDCCEIVSRSRGITETYTAFPGVTAGFQEIGSRSHANPTGVPQDFTAPAPVQLYKIKFA